MKVINATNVNDAFRRAIKLVQEARLIKRGDTYEYPTPVATVYSQPTERVLFDPVRDCNPFFHFMESLWMLAGRDDVAWISRFTSNIAQFSDDGVTFHGAYGDRWRYHFNRDQLETLVQHLRSNMRSRQAVLSMWDPSADLDCTSRDIPCNTHVYFKVDQEIASLNMTVCCRSNDVIWGCYGANVVHFSTLHEYMAGRLGLEVGRYTHLSDSWHIYPSNPRYAALITHHAPGRPDYYANDVDMQLLPLFLGCESDTDKWTRDLLTFMRLGVMGEYHTEYFDGVAVPMLDAWMLYENDKFDEASDALAECGADDWRTAGTEWLDRRSS